MGDPETPLRQMLQDGCDETDLQRVWRRVQQTQARRSPAPRTMAWVLAAAACLMLVSAWFLIVPSRDRSGALSAGGRELVVLSTEGATEPKGVELSDGSLVSLSPGTRVEVLENDARSFHTALRRGRGTFEVRPGGSRKWIVECGGVVVEVLGTKFDLQREPGVLRVSVERGVVLVRGERVPDRVVKLGAGQALEVPTDDALSARPSAEPTARQANSESPSECASATAPAVSASSEARVSSAPAAPAVSSDALEALLKEADAARLAGDRVRAAQLLQRVITESRGDPRGAMAAFALAQLQVRDQPSSAAETLGAALDAGVPRSLEEDTWARLVQAYAKAGDRTRAAEAARQYEIRFPNGARLAEVRRWASGGP